MNDIDNPFNDPDAIYSLWYWTLVPLNLLPKYPKKVKKPYTTQRHMMVEFLDVMVEFRDKWVEDTMDDRIGMI